MTLVMFQVVVGEQHLRDVQLESGEELFVSGHEPGLPDRRARLQFIEARRALLEAEHAHARAHRARGDQHHFAARRALRRHLRHQLPDLRQIRLLARIGEHAGAQLDHEAADIFQQLGTHGAVPNTAGGRA